jgi:hypothetical protein
MNNVIGIILDPVLASIGQEAEDVSGHEWQMHRKIKIPVPARG